jgi:hypothetical protein
MTINLKVIFVGIMIYFFPSNLTIIISFFLGEIVKILEFEIKSLHIKRNISIIELYSQRYYNCNVIGSFVSNIL